MTVLNFEKIMFLKFYYFKGVSIMTVILFAYAKPC